MLRGAALARTLAARHERCRGELDREHRSCPSTAVRTRYGPRRSPCRVSSGEDGSCRGIAASFLKAGPAWDAARLEAAVAPAASAPAAHAARLGFRCALACVARDGQHGHAARSPAVFFEGGRAGLFLVAVSAGQVGRGRRAVTPECRSASAKGWLVRHSACRVPRLFASLPCPAERSLRPMTDRYREVARFRPSGTPRTNGGAPWLCDERSRVPQRHHDRGAGRAPARRPDGGARLILSARLWR